VACIEKEVESDFHASGKVKLGICSGNGKDRSTV
jgi:hypothetical protein